MKNFTNDDSDFDIIDGKQVLKRGRTLHVPMMFMDSADPRAAAAAVLREDTAARAAQ